MTATTPEFLFLENVRDWLAGFDSWAAWTGDAKDSDAIKAHVVWPIEAAATFPVCVLTLKASRRVNFSAAAGPGNWFPSGTVLFSFYDADPESGDLEADYQAFGENLFGVIGEMKDKSAEAPVILSSIELDETPIVRSPWLAKEDEDLGLWYQGQGLFTWGVESIE